MALKLSEIRDAFKQQVETVSGFHLVNVLPDYFGRARETIAHLGFVISVNNTSQQSDERQRRQVGIYVNTTVVVSFAYRLRPMDIYPTDYDLALNAEEQVLLACLNSYRTIEPEVQVRYNTSNRQATTSNEYMIITIDFTVLHTIGV